MIQASGTPTTTAISVAVSEVTSESRRASVTTSPASRAGRSDQGTRANSPTKGTTNMAKPMAPSITNKTGGRRVRRLAEVSVVKVM
jgi:hypothetical protein